MAITSAIRVPQVCLSAASLAFLAGCSVIHDPDEAPGHYFGYARIDQADNGAVATAPDLTRTRIVGLWSDASGVGLGYAARQRLKVPETCRTIILVDHTTDFEAVRIFLDQLEDGETGTCALPAPD